MQLFIGHIENDKALLTENEAHHMHRVLRMQTGEEVHVTDGKGRLFRGVIASLNAKNAVIGELSELENLQKRNYRVEMAVALTKQIDRIEFFLEKAVEVGLDAFHPINCFHSERRKVNEERLERVAVAAMKQSLKAEKTVVSPLQNFNEFLDEHSYFSGQKFIAHCHDELLLQPIRQLINPNISYLFLIGPEGDFSKEEVELAVEKGFIPISLGPQRLRTETAALCCVMISHYLHLEG